MRVYKENDGLPIKAWAEHIEESALYQAKNLAALPFTFKHVALMPDCHTGYGMPIGGVLATKGVVIPNAVGVDIGCGMTAMRINVKDITSKELNEIYGMVKESVPVGFAKHNKPRKIPPIADYDLHANSIVHQERENAELSIGTLGGGNHFIEFQQDTDGYLWIMVHSGSRNLGYKVAKHHNDIAVDLNEKWYTSVPKEWELAFLPQGTIEYTNYIKEQAYCIQFAKLSRSMMIDASFKAVFTVLRDHFFKDMMIIDQPHNYARMEHHFGKNVMVHRKGSQGLRVDELGIVPGSQGTKSYIVEGLGNPMSFSSCSHGAGRVMGRKQAKEVLDLKEEQKKMTGIIHNIDSVDKLDEAPSAYKNIEDVMWNQRELVKVKYKLTPLAVIKG